LWVPAKNWQPEWKLVTIPLGMVAEGTTVVEADREAVASKPRDKGNSKGNTTP
jgi:hypothetical protein